VSRLHWYGPRSTDRSHRPGGPYLRRARYKLYTFPEYTSLRDRKGHPYVWMGTDCGWEWLETRPGIYGRIWSVPFRKLHEHVHTPGSW
jgi:hypothetical protein